MELRTLTPDDGTALSFLMAEAFNGGNRPAPALAGAPPASDITPSTTWGIFDGARLAAAVTAHNLHLAWGQRVAPMGGIAGVACVADQRGRGHVARLMAHSLTQMREAGQFLSGLYPFAWAFYRRFGWEWVGERREYTVPTAQIRAAPEGRQMRFYEGPEALETAKPVFAQFARRYRGMITREDPTPDYWKIALEHHDSRTTYVHAHHDPDTGDADGYLTFRFGGDVPKIGDFYALNPAAYRGLLSVLHYYGTQAQKVSVRGPADAPLPLHVMHWDLETKVLPLFMGRVVDVGAALAALRPAPGLGGRIVFAVQDSACDWNEGTWGVSVDGGRVTAARVDEAPGVTLDIQAFTQAYWGQPSLPLLRGGGRVSVTDERQYDLLTALLPPAVCFLDDFF